MKTTVVIPNYNGKKYLENCLRSLETARMQEDFHVIIIDNGSADHSLSEMESRYPWMECVYFAENRGFCAAVNEGIRRAKTPYVFLLNNDTTVEPDCIRVLEQRMDREPDLFSLSARMVDMKNPEMLDGAGDLYSALGWAYAIGKGKTVSAYMQKMDIFSACGGAAMYRRAAFESIGLFDELHFAYLEDVDLGYRARIHGWRNAYEPEAVVNHAGSASTGSRYNEFKIRHSARNNVYLIYKNMPPLQMLLNLPFLLTGFGIKTLFFGKKGFGKLYVKSLMEGCRLCSSPEGRKKRVRFGFENLGNYIKIQLELWLNIFRRI